MVSVIIRVLNEISSLEKLLKILQVQKLNEEVEIIVVDNESDDGTAKLAKRMGAKVITIKRNEFNYPKAINIGCEVAKGELIVLLSAHSFPTSNKFLANGIRHFRDKRVAGVYGPNWPNKGSGIFEFLFYFLGTLPLVIRKTFAVKKVRMGVFSATGNIFRRDLWEKNHFDEKYELGGEDGAWAAWALSNNYKIIFDRGFAVRHSYGLNYKTFKKQFKHWEEVQKPNKFERKKLEFRKKGKY